MHLILLLVFFLPTLFAVSIGNPSLPSLLQEGLFVPDQCWSNPQCGVSGDYLIQKKLRACRQSHPLRLRSASLWGISEIGCAAWSIRERFNLQLELGSGQFRWQWRQSTGLLSGQAKGGLIWSGDAKLIVMEVKDTSFALDGHAGGWDWMDGRASLHGISLPNETQSYLRYWQIGAALTQKFSSLAPYLGCAVNRTRFKVSHLTTGNGRLHARHAVGPFVGCSICNGSRFLANVEYRSLFEEGVSLSAQIRF